MPGELDCYYDMNEFDRELDDPLEELEQDLYHRLVEPPGSNIDDPDRGVGVEDELSGFADPSLQRRIETDFERDDRVAACRARITKPDASASEQQGVIYRIEIEVETVNGATIGVVYDFDGNGLRRAA